MKKVFRTHGLHERRSRSKFTRHIISLQLVVFGYKAKGKTAWNAVVQAGGPDSNTSNATKYFQRQFIVSCPKFTETIWWMGRVWQNVVHTLEPEESVRTMWQVADSQRETHQTRRHVRKTPFLTTEEIHLEELQHDFSLPHGTVFTIIQEFTTCVNDGCRENPRKPKEHVRTCAHSFLQQCAASGYEFLELIVKWRRYTGYQNTPETKRASMEWKQPRFQRLKKFKVVKSACNREQQSVQVHSVRTATLKNSR